MGTPAYADGASGATGAFTGHGASRIIRPMAKKRPEPERIAIPMPAELVEQIDDFRWANRLPTRAEAIRQLIELGLKTKPEK